MFGPPNPAGPSNLQSRVTLVDQFFDHNDPSPGTFKQCYWLDVNYYKIGAEPTASWGMSTEHELMGAGGPIVLFTPGEIDICHQW